MKKELKEYIKANKLSDDDILKLISAKPTEETDIKDESEDGSESQADPEEPEKAEEGTAKEESLTKEIVAKMIAEALKGKVAPKPKPKGEVVKHGGFQLLS
jgi:hypothetical protein